MGTPTNPGSSCSPPEASNPSDPEQPVAAGDACRFSPPNSYWSSIVRLAGDAVGVAKPHEPVNVPQLALSVDQAAAALGVSSNTFRRYVLPYVRSVKLGQARIVPVAELGKWLHLNAGFADEE